MPFVETLGQVIGLPVVFLPATPIRRGDEILSGPTAAPVRNYAVVLTIKEPPCPNLAQQILAHAAPLPEGASLSAKALLHLGSRAAVDQALSRLARSGKLLRAGRGIYVLPVKGRFEARAPEVAKVLQEWASQRGETVIGNGAAAANARGLTTQVPVRQVFLTSGRSRKLKVARQPRQCPGDASVTFFRSFARGSARSAARRGGALGTPAAPAREGRLVLPFDYGAAVTGLVLALLATRAMHCPRTIGAWSTTVCCWTMPNRSTLC